MDSLTYRSLVSLIVPAYNEPAIVLKNITKLYDYMKSIDADYTWEVFVVNDGSTDQTGGLANVFARNGITFPLCTTTGIWALEEAFRTAFKCCRQGRYIVTLDMDLSYSLNC